MSDKTGRAEATHRERAALAAQPMPSSWPQDADGNYMAVVSGSCSDLVPTIAFGNVIVGPVSIQRPVVASSIQEIIDAARETQRAAEFVVGIERRLLTWAVDPASKIRSPVDAKDAFAAPPAGYDPNGAPDPRAPIEAAETAQAAVVTPVASPTPTDQPRMNTHQQNNAAPAGPQIG